jgi:hypothetical protein
LNGCPFYSCVRRRLLSCFEKKKAGRIIVYQSYCTITIYLSERFCSFFLAPVGFHVDDGICYGTTSQNSFVRSPFPRHMNRGM